jgi:tetratricopeptide (TPR) repeat protein/uncharacterized caspase-like protein
MTKRYALIIGNSVYTDKTLQQLITPAQDVEALAHVLRNPDIGNFEVSVRLDAESHRLRRDIERFFAKRKANDTLLFYFSGHGVIEGHSGELHLAVKDTERDVLRSTAIPSSFIRQNVRDSHSGSKVIILDCCYSGAITNEMLTKGPYEVAMGAQFTGRGVVFLSASTAWQYAFQGTEVERLSEDTQSLFTRFLARGLETGEADLDGDGIITVNELYDYVFDLVRKVAPNQTPEISDVGRQGDIIVATSVGGDVRDIQGRSERDEIHIVSSKDYDLTLIDGIYQFAFVYYKAKDWPNTIKWLREVVERNPKYKDVDSLLEDAQKQLKLATLYEQGQRAFDIQDWRTAFNLFQEVLDVDPNYKNTGDLYNEACKEIELPRLYQQALQQWHNQDWDRAIETLTRIHDLDSRYKDAPWLLEQAWQKKRLEEDYRRATERCVKAEVTKQQEDWQEAATLLQKIADKDPGYKTVSAKLARAQKQLEYFELVRQGKESYARKEWQGAMRCLEQAININSWDPELEEMLDKARDESRQQKAARQQRMLELYNRGSECYQRRKWGEAVDYFEEAVAIDPNYTDLPVKLSEARKGLRQQRVIRISLTVLNLVLFTIVFAIFQNQIATIGDYIWKELIRGRATPPPTVAILRIDRIEVLMDGGQLKLDQLPGLTRGEAVVLEVIVFDTDGKRYTSDDLICKWSVAPLGDKDVGINTDRCKTLYIPSQEYSSQTVRFGVEGFEQQFKPLDPISMKFDIAE